MRIKIVANSRLYLCFLLALILALGFSLLSSSSAWAAPTDPPFYVTQWGTLGSGDGQFNRPNGVAVDGAGNVYVADYQNYRMQKFSSTGILLAQWGTLGSGDGQFNRPNGVAVDGAGNVYVADVLNHRIQKFSSTGAYLTQWGSDGTGDGQFKFPSGVAVGGDGDVYVADSDNHRIQKFSSTGAYLTQWGSSGTGDGQFDSPLGVAVDDDGNVYVTDHLMHRIQKFSSTGAYLTQWGSFGTGDGQFNRPYGITVDGDGTVYVAEFLNNRIQKFSSTGTYLTQWGSFGTGDGRFQSPWGIAVDGDGTLYVADNFNHRIQKFAFIEDSDNDGLLNYLDECEETPTGATVDANGCAVSQLDDDGDGVPNGLDTFPNDPTESNDADGDGVGDNADAFPNDPAEINDADGDGVGDNTDAFPNDPTEQSDTDSDGVGDNADAFPNDATESVDSDGDGTGDNADAFPNDPAETTDTDGDGVGNNADICAATAVGAEVNASGCAPLQLDDDGDGVTNDLDLCAATATGATANADGCAASQLDDDNDGVTNDLDQCVATAAGSSVDTNGCASSQLDDDGDGVTNDLDQCTATAAGASVDANGCASSQLDDDGDGVQNDADAFPDDPTESVDTDGDGVGDNTDAFPLDPTEQADSDGDGVGDNGDNCPAIANPDQSDGNSNGTGDACENQLPIAVADSYAIDAGATLNVPAPGVLGNDSDPDATDTRTSILVNTTSHGTLTLNEDGSFSYQPQAGYSGADSFQYLVRDNHGGESAPVTVSITVNAASTTSPLILLSSNTNGNSGNFAYRDEDIIIWNPATAKWSMLFDGSDVGLGNYDIDAFTIHNGKIYFSLAEDIQIGGFGLVDDADILAFHPLILGNLTLGLYSMVLDGSDVGLNTAGEDIDAIGFDADGKLVVSVNGAFSAPGFPSGTVSGDDEDLFVLNNADFGANTKGKWSLYFDGSDVDLTTSGEDLQALWANHTQQQLYFATFDDYAVPGLSGNEDDIILCTYISLGADTACTFTRYWDGQAHGFTGGAIDGVQFLALPPSLNGLFVSASASVDDVDGMALVNTPTSIGTVDLGNSKPSLEAPGDDTVEFPGDDLDQIDEPDSTEDDIKQLNQLFVPSIRR